MEGHWVMASRMRFSAVTSTLSSNQLLVSVHYDV
jgi:hypothetical protein